MSSASELSNSLGVLVALLGPPPEMPLQWPMPADAPRLPDSPVSDAYARLDSLELRARFVNAEAWPGENRDYIKAHPVAGPLWTRIQQYHADHAHAMRLRELHRQADFRMSWLSVIVPKLLAWSATFAAELEGGFATEGTEDPEADHDE